MKVDSSGVQLDVQIEGAGKPVVLLHGFPDSKRLWARQVPALVDAGFQVIVPDQRGYGASDKPAEVDAYAIPFLAIDVTAILDALSIERAHIVGHDWGAAVAWATASFAPERVDHWSHCQLGIRAPSAVRAVTQREKSWYMLLFQFAGVAEHWLSDETGAGCANGRSIPMSRLSSPTSNATAHSPPDLNWYRANITPEAFVGPPMELPPIQAPAMGVWSSGDFALTETQMIGSAKFCTNGFRYERIEGPGHWMQIETPDKVNALLLDFLPT